jgi:hypothetical protein
MTWSYDLTNDIGQVRLLISDTDIVPVTDAHFSDEEITVFLTLAGNDVYLAAALALQSWAGFLSGAVDSERIGDYSYSKKQVSNMLALAQTYTASAGNAPAMDWAEMDLDCVGEDE